MDSRTSSGFTIVELMIAVILVAFLIISFSIASVSFMNAMFNSTTEAQLTAEAQSLTRTITSDVRSATEVRATNTITDANKGGGWSSNASTLVLAVPAENNSRDLIFDSSGEDPRTNEIVYFVENGTLKIRSLANSSAPGNFAVTSCPLASATSSCPVDVTLSSNLASFAIQYRDDTDAVTATPADATSVRITLTLENSRGNQPIQVTKELRLSVRTTE